MNGEKEYKMTSVYWIAAVLGVALIITGTVWLAISENFKKNAVQTEAIITKIEKYKDSDGEDSYDVFVEFYTDDEKIEGSLGYHSNGMSEGDIVTVFYDPDNPNKFQNSSNGIMIFVILMIFGIPFTLVGFLPPIMKVITAIKKRRATV